jgi:hypothetical protein
MKYFNKIKTYRRANKRVIELAGELYRDNETNDVDTLKSTVVAITDEFYAIYEQYPSSDALEKLATVLLKNDFKDRDNEKSIKSKYAVLSEHQLHYRHKREMILESTDNLDYQYYKGLAANGNYFKRITQEKRTSRT